MTPEQRERLVKLLGMLGSDHVGERAVAARKVEEHRAEIGSGWEEIVGSVATAAPPVAEADPLQTDGIDRKLPRDLLDGYADRLSTWEKSFLGDMAARAKAGQSFSDGQKRKLFDIATAMSNPPRPKHRPFGMGGA